MLLFIIGAITGLDSAQARPGGGHSSSSSSHSYGSSGFSYHSSGSHYSSGGGSYSGDPGDLFVTLIIIGVILYILYASNKAKSGQTFTAGPTPLNRIRQQNSIKDQLALLKLYDANFSSILFLDFVHSLYNKFYSYSTHPEFSYLTPFISTELQQYFDQTNPWTVSEVVINGIKWLDINTQGSDTDSISISIDIDANYTLHQQGKSTRYAVLDRWQLYRQKGVLSPEPEKMQTLCCPQCGAPAHFTDAGTCDHCGTFIQKGSKQWYLGKCVMLKNDVIASNDLVAYAEEQGTQLPTIKQVDLIQQINRFKQEHTISDWQVFWRSFETDIVKAYFLTIYLHWSQRNWQGVRHLLSDRLYETNAFWQALYAEHNWYNRLDNLGIQQVELVKIELDKYYEAITVRIFAACNDYTEDAQGKLIGGSKKLLRRYTEYWTLVRRTGTEQHTKPYSLSQCPKCGAPADNMGQTAECGYCGSKISTGQFSWVLFLITQDEVYDG